MTFLEAALEILKRERKPLHYKELTEKAMERKLLTFVGRTPEVTMQTQLTNTVKKAPGAPFVRVKPGVFGLLRYPEAPLEPPAEAREASSAGGNGGEGPGSASEGERDPQGRRRRRGGRGKGRRGELPEGAARPAPSRAAAKASGDETDSAEEGERDGSEGHEAPDEPEIGSLSAEARAAALAETGVLESEDDEGPGEDDLEPEEAAAGTEESQTAAAESEDDEDDEDDDEPESEAGEGNAATGTAAAGPGGEARSFDDAGPGRRRRRRRRRRRGGENGLPEAFGGNLEASAAPGGERGAESASAAEGGLATSAEATRPAESAAPVAPAAEPPPDSGPQAGRRVMSPIDAAIEILKGQAPGRGVHVRQIADGAVRRRLVHGEPNEAWRVMRAALAAEPRERLRAGLRPRVRAAGSGLYALARRPPDMDLERAEHVFGEARRALRERTVAGLEQRLAELTPSAFEAVARVLLQREGFGPATFVKRVEGTIYLEALRGRGSRPSRCLIAMRPGVGSGAGRRAIGELRAGIRARNQDEGVLMLAGRLGEEAIAEWRQPGPPVEVVDGPALAETCIRHGVGVINATISVDFVDADFLAEIAEG
jgi:HB1, ASXL, restriction endonuclease HTH domain/Restriction endonuclease